MNVFAAFRFIYSLRWAVLAASGVAWAQTGPAVSPQVAAGTDHSLALSADGSVYSWGRDIAGQLGLGRLRESAIPVRVAGAGGFRAVAVGRHHVLGLTADGLLYAWGNNFEGQIGDGTNTDRPQPVLVDRGFRAIAAGADSSFAIKSN